MDSSYHASQFIHFFCLTCVGTHVRYVLYVHAKTDFAPPPSLTVSALHQFPLLHLVHQKLLDPLREVLLQHPPDGDNDEDDDDGDESQPEGVLQHALAQRLERDVLHRLVAMRA